MLQTPVREHLINVRAAGLPLQDIYITDGWPNPDLTVHAQQCPEVLYVQPSDVSDLADEFRLSDCITCQNLETATVTDWISNLRLVAEDAQELGELMMTLLDDDGIPNDSTWDSAKQARDTATSYAALGRRLRPTVLYAGASCAEAEYRDLADQTIDDYAALGEYAIELTHDARVQWQRLARHTPMRARAIGPRPPVEGTRVRAIEDEDDFGNYGYNDEDDTAYDDALRVEARRILKHGGWDLIDWHDQLVEYLDSDGHDVADVRGLNPAQLEQVLTIYATSGREGAPLQQLVDAVTAAHAR